LPAYDTQATAVGLFGRHPILIAEQHVAFLMRLSSADATLFDPSESMAARHTCMFFNHIVDAFSTWGYKSLADASLHGKHDVHLTYTMIIRNAPHLPT
jgi:hypothetical protein